MRFFLGLACLLVFCEISAAAQTPPPAPSEELNTLLMHATFLISGQNKDNPAQTSGGTVFIMGIPRPNDAKLALGVMITAAHVLNDMGSDLTLRLLYDVRMLIAHTRRIPTKFPSAIINSSRYTSNIRQLMSPLCILIYRSMFP